MSVREWIEYSLNLRNSLISSMCTAPNDCTEGVRRASWSGSGGNHGLQKNRNAKYFPLPCTSNSYQAEGILNERWLL